MHRPANVAVVLLVAAGAFLGGSWYARQSLNQDRTDASRKPLRYVCPMHPQYTSDKPGQAPCCGMPLEPVYAGMAAPKESGAPAGAIHVDADRQQLIGVRTQRAAKEGGRFTIRTTGRVAADENRLYRVNAARDLWIRKVYPPIVGSRVRKDEPLVEFWAANLYSAGEAYLYALDARDRQAKTTQNSPTQLQPLEYRARQALENLQNLGVTDSDIEEMTRTREPKSMILLRSPTDGVVLSRTATMGDRVGASTELYQIAELGQVWIYADLFENEARYVRPGMTARARVAARDLSFNARVSEVPPAFDAQSRIMKVRLDAANPRMALWPGMFVDVEFLIELPPAISVPAGAVMDSGRQRTVFVARGNGYFEPRPVETGWRFGDRIEIVQGLASDEEIVAEGNFLLDSESRMRMAAAGVEEAAKDPVCGMQVDRRKARAGGLTGEFEGKVRYFCSEHCKKTFDKDPARYAAGPGRDKPHTTMRNAGS
ncbi:MAG: efflux RND transporter periplasmic adaptor subunit [Bryobacteraceae bacterium]|nr:efflux RND transporter periplasmic adaptor subunit [Bryobacteraceae bacterium]